MANATPAEPENFWDAPAEGPASTAVATRTKTDVARGGDAAPLVSQPVGPAAGMAMSVEQQRAIAEIQTSMFVARQFPRDIDTVIARVREACQRQSLAEIAEFSYPRGGEEVSGPSVYLLKAIAQAWGNIEYGIRELSRLGGQSTVQAFAWDMQTGAKQILVFEVKHWRDTKKGGYAVRDERDVYELVANMGSRRLRACLEGVIPEDIKQIAIAECAETMNRKGLVTPEKIKKMLTAFEEFGVTQARIEAKFGRRIDSISPNQMVRLGKTFLAIKDLMITPDEAFPPLEGEAVTSVATNKGTDALKARLNARAKPEAPATAERQPGEES